MTEVRTLVDYFASAHRCGQERLAFRIRTSARTEELTNRALFGRAEQFTTAYRAAGLRPGGNVLIVLAHSGDLLCAFVGAVLGGFVPAVLPPPSNRQDMNVFWAHMAEMVRLTGDAPIVAAEALRDSLPADSPLHARTFISPDGLGEPAPFPWHRPAADDTAFLQFSSGTTGLRKGVVITHRMIHAQVESYRDVLGIADGDRIASWLPLYHDMGLVACFLESLALGMPATLVDPFYWVSYPYVLFEEIEAFRATHVWMPNFGFNHLVHTVDPEKPYDLSSMKAFINSSEPCKIETFDLFRESFGPWGVSSEKLLTCYAMAESVFAVTQSARDEPVPVLELSHASLLQSGRAEAPANGERSLRVPSVGRLLPGLELRVLDDRGREQADRHVGEIELRGTMVTAGYLNNDEATSAALHDGWYRTGDLGFRADGELYITGRKKELLIVHGRNYYAHDIEAIVSAFPEIKPGRVVAFGNANELTGSEDLVILAELAQPDANEDQAVLRRRIKEAVTAELGVAATTVGFVPAGWIVKTTSGKLDRDNNRKKFLGGVG